MVAGAGFDLPAGLATYIGLIRLDDSATPAHWAGLREIRHRKANTVGQEPRGLVGDP